MRHVARASGRRGQGTLEYILILVVILAAILVATGKIRIVMVNKVFQGAEDQLNRAGDALIVKP